MHINDKQRHMSYWGQDTPQKSQQNPLIRALIPIPHNFVILCFTVSKTALTSVENILYHNSIS